MVKKKDFEEDAPYNSASVVESLRSSWKMSEVAVAEDASKTYNKVRLVNKIGSRVKLPGSITGELYIWERSGAVVEVDERDAPVLLEKRLGDNACCGSGNKNFVFEIMEV